MAEADDMLGKARASEESRSEAVSGRDEPARPALRLVEPPEPKKKSYEPDPEITAMFDDIRRQQAEREERDPGGKDAA